MSLCVDLGELVPEKFENFLVVDVDGESEGEGIVIGVDLVQKDNPRVH